MTCLNLSPQQYTTKKENSARVEVDKKVDNLWIKKLHFKNKLADYSQKLTFAFQLDKILTSYKKSIITLIIIQKNESNLQAQKFKKKKKARI